MSNLNEDASVRVLEALLFATPEPLSVKDLHERMPGGSDVGAALMELQKRYEGRGVALVEMEGQWAFRTAPDVSPALEINRQAERRLSRAAMETLAIIAYHQPVTRAEIENIRGVATHKGTLDALMEAGWIKPGRRREAPGRPLTWVTTPAFLDQFSLESIMDLPGLDDLKASGLLDRRPAIEAIPSGDLFEKILEEEGSEEEPGDDDDEDDFEEEAADEDEDSGSE